MTGRTPGLLGVFGVLAASAGLVAAASALPPPQRTSTPIAKRLPISRSTPALVCPGPETLLVPDGGAAVDSGVAVLVTALVGSESGPSSARLQVAGARSETAAAAALPARSGPASVPLSRGRSLTLTATAPGPAIAALAVTALGPALLRTSDQPASGSPPMLAAVQSTLARSGDLRSLVATTCTVPTSDGWLVGGSTGSGARLRLLLANPASVPAVVDVDVHGPNGSVPAPSGEGVVVPAGGEVPIFIDALAPGLKQLALHISTRSGRVQATLNHSRLLGLDPGGADDVPVAAAPAKKQMIPGISLVNGYGKTADDPAAPGSTAVRIAVPGSEEAVVRVRLLDSSGALALPRAAVVSVPAGGVVDVPVAGIPSGTYTAVVDSDVPIVAGALVGRAGVAGTAAAAEFAWAAAARPLAGRGYLVLPPGARSTLSLVAPQGDGQVSVAQVRRDGSVRDPERIEVPGGTSATVQFDPDTVAVRIGEVGGGPVGAALVSWVTDPRGSLISVLSVDLAVPSTSPALAVADRGLGLR